MSKKMLMNFLISAFLAGVLLSTGGTAKAANRDNLQEKMVAYQQIEEMANAQSYTSWYIASALALMTIAGSSYVSVKK